MRPIPLSTKSEIFRKYLEGYSIPEISKLFNVSGGTVWSIAKEETTKDGYYFVIREVTKVFRKNNLEISDVILGIRLYNKIKELGLTIPFFEDFLEFTNTESFRIGMDHEKFLEIVKRILHFEKIFKRKIEDIPDFLDNAMKEYPKLASDILKARQELVGIALPTHVDWVVISDTPFKKASRIAKIKIEPKILYKKLNLIYKEPHKHIDILKQIMNSSND
jgi:hypothetical protein